MGEDAFWLFLTLACPGKEFIVDVNLHKSPKGNFIEINEAYSLSLSYKLQRTIS